MELPTNRFKAGLAAGVTQIGMWSSLVDPVAAEIAAGAGFDWLLVDGEHAPNDLRTILAQLQAMAPYTQTTPIVRPPIGDVVLIKQLLDIGVQTLLVPMVETPEQAAEMVAAMQYPPKGIRGVGSALARASRWNRVADYVHKAGDEMCLLVQVENVRGFENLDAIAAVPGVDGVFIGPADLSASFGHLGNAGHPEMQARIDDAIARIKQAGKAAGILSFDDAASRRYVEMGCGFVAVGADGTLLARAVEGLAARFKK